MLPPFHPLSSLYQLPGIAGPSSSGRAQGSSDAERIYHSFFHPTNRTVFPGPPRNYVVPDVRYRTNEVDSSSTESGGFSNGDDVILSDVEERRLHSRSRSPICLSSSDDNELSDYIQDGNDYPRSSIRSRDHTEDDRDISSSNGLEIPDSSLVPIAGQTSPEKSRWSRGHATDDTSILHGTSTSETEQRIESTLKRIKQTLKIVKGNLDKRDVSVVDNNIPHRCKCGQLARHMSSSAHELEVDRPVDNADDGAIDGVKKFCICEMESAGVKVLNCESIADNSSRRRVRKHSSSSDIEFIRVENNAPEQGVSKVRRWIRPTLLPRRSIDIISDSEDDSRYFDNQKLIVRRQNDEKYINRRNNKRRRYSRKSGSHEEHPVEVLDMNKVPSEELSLGDRPIESVGPEDLSFRSVGQEINSDKQGNIENLRKFKDETAHQWNLETFSQEKACQREIISPDEPNLASRKRNFKKHHTGHKKSTMDDRRRPLENNANSYGEEQQQQSKSDCAQSIETCVVVSQTGLNSTEGDAAEGIDARLLAGNEELTSVLTNGSNDPLTTGSSMSAGIFEQNETRMSGLSSDVLIKSDVLVPRNKAMVSTKSRSIDNIENDSCIVDLRICSERASDARTDKQSLMTEVVPVVGGDSITMGGDSIKMGGESSGSSTDVQSDSNVSNIQADNKCREKSNDKSLMDVLSVCHKVTKGGLDLEQSSGFVSSSNIIVPTFDQPSSEISAADSVDICLGVDQVDCSIKEKSNKLAKEPKSELVKVYDWREGTNRGESCTSLTLEAIDLSSKEGETTGSLQTDALKIGVLESVMLETDDALNKSNALESGALKISGFETGSRETNTLETGTWGTYSLATGASDASLLQSGALCKTSQTSSLLIESDNVPLRTSPLNSCDQYIRTKMVLDRRSRLQSSLDPSHCGPHPYLSNVHRADTRINDDEVIALESDESVQLVDDDNQSDGCFSGNIRHFSFVAGKI